MNRHNRRKAEAQARRKPRIDGEHNYLTPIFEAIANEQPDRGRLTIVNISHDDWCEVYRGELCNCNPEISFQPLGKPEELQ